MTLPPPAALRAKSEGRIRPSAPVLQNDLYPPGGGRLLLHHDPVQERRRLREPFLRRQQAVLVLDRKDIIVAEHAQRRSELLPPLRAVSVAARAEDPRPIALVRIALGVEHAGQRQVAVVNL